MAKRKKPSYYAVRAGRKPGVYRSWEECEKQVSGFSNACFKGFDSYNDAVAFVGDAAASNEIQTPEATQEQKHEESRPSLENLPGSVSVKVEDASALMPPPASQSYFDQFSHFTPNASAPFDDEFNRFASSQGLVSGSQEFRKERTKAISDELKFHYSSQLNDISEIPEAFPEHDKDEFTDEEKLDIYQNMCREIGVDQGVNIEECRRELKKVLVNIIDYIDARRVPGKKIEIWDWDDFDKFSEYSWQDDKRMDSKEAQKNGGFLSALLQKLRRPGQKKRKRGGPDAKVIKHEKIKHETIKKEESRETIKKEESGEEGNDDDVRFIKRVRVSNYVVID